MQNKSFFRKLIKYLRVDNHTFTFIVFVIVSAILWLLNTLSKTYNTSMSIPVQFVWSSNDYMIHSPMPKQLTMQIEGTGFTILSYKTIMPLSSFRFDLSSHFEGKEDSVISANIVTQLVKKQIEQYFKENFIVDEIKPEKINASFSKMSFKKMAVQFAGDLKFESQYWLKGKILITPDSIIVGGPKNILDTTDVIYTKFLQFKDIRKQILKNTTIDTKGVFIVQNPEIKIVINTEKFTETSLRLPVTIVNEPPKSNVLLFPDYSTIRFLISIQELEQLDPSTFQLIADFNQTSYTSDKEQIKVDLITHPETVKILSINPREVTYIINLQK